MVNKAIFLDRDGVINKSFIVSGKPKAPRLFSEFKFLPKSKKSINLLSNLDFLIFVITNQPDIGNGYANFFEVKLMNERIINETNVKEVFMCPHSQKSKCQCRKPKNKLILNAKSKYKLSLHDSYIIGDRYTDIQTGLNSGCKTIFIDRKYKEILPKNYDHRVKNIYQAALIVKKNNS